MEDHQFFTVGDIVSWSDSKDPAIERTVELFKKEFGNGLFRVSKTCPSGDVRIGSHPQRLKVRSVDGPVVAFAPTETHTGVSWFSSAFFKKYVRTGE